MHIYNIIKASKMGSAHPDYGQSYWCEVKESDFPIMFNTKASYVPEGQVIVAEEQEKKTSEKGNEYLRLKKVKLADSGSQGTTSESVPTSSEPATQAVPNSQPATALGVGHFNLLMKELRDIGKKLDRLMGEDTVVEPSDNEDLSEGDWLPTDEQEPMPNNFLEAD